MSNLDRSERSTQQDSPYIQTDVGGFVSRLSWYARQKMYKSLIQLAHPTAQTTVLDVGVTSDRRQDSNFFEKLYPYSHNLTAIGLEDASFLELQYPGLKFVKADGARLPFADRSFDLVVSFAVLEHVGDRARQREFVRELCRVGRTCYITTPNRWYPIEFHTLVPFLHWLPPTWFRFILKLFGQKFFAQEQNLNLLSEQDVLKFFPRQAQVKTKHFKLLGLVSNLCFYIQND